MEQTVHYRVQTENQMERPCMVVKGLMTAIDGNVTIDNADFGRIKMQRLTACDGVDL